MVGGAVFDNAVGKRGERSLRGDVVHLHLPHFTQSITTPSITRAPRDDDARETRESVARPLPQLHGEGAHTIETRDSHLPKHLRP